MPSIEDDPLYFVREQHIKGALVRALRTHPTWSGIDSDTVLLDELSACLAMAYGIGQRSIRKMTLRELFEALS